MRGTLAERLHARLVPCADPACDCDGCLLWTGCTNSKGYGVIGADGKRLLTHRAAWSLDNEPIPDEMTIDHVHTRGCRHKTCALVAHLELVTTGENTRRWLAHGHRTHRPYRSRITPPDPAYLAALADWIDGDGPPPEDLGFIAPWQEATA